MTVPGIPELLPDAIRPSGSEASAAMILPHRQSIVDLQSIANPNETARMVSAPRLG
jgi:hypothetical protein